ncbi:MAG: hypothetical protein ACLFQY_12790 [Desulfococcaceae bacterium]
MNCWPGPIGGSKGFIVWAPLAPTFTGHREALEREVDRAENRVVKLRDCLIERLRADKPSAERARRRESLDRVNQVLSLIAGVEYPATGIHKNYMKDARQVLSETEKDLPDELKTDTRI